MNDSHILIVCIDISNKNIETNLIWVFLLQIAVYGKNFCTSAKDAFFLILRNIVRYSIYTSAGFEYTLIIVYYCYTFISLLVVYLISEWWYWTRSQTMSCFSVNFWLQHLLVSSNSNVIEERNKLTVFSYPNLKIITANRR